MLIHLRLPEVKHVGGCAGRENDTISITDTKTEIRKYLRICFSPTIAMYLGMFEDKTNKLWQSSKLALLHYRRIYFITN